MSERLAAMAEQHYRDFLPESYAAITDTTTFFRTLGEAAQDQIEAMAESLRGPDPGPGEPFAERMARYVVARSMAESEAIRELILVAPAPEPGPTEDQELSSALTDFRDAVAKFYEAE